MSHSLIGVTFDTEFPVPRDECPLKQGEVVCKVIRAECDVIDRWKDFLTFRVKIVLKITIKSGGLLCSFLNVVHFKETCFVDWGVKVFDCKVTAATCRCVLHRGKVRCSGALQVKFVLKKPCPCPHPRPCRCEPVFCPDPCEDDLCPDPCELDLCPDPCDHDLCPDPCEPVFCPEPVKCPEPLCKPVRKRCPPVTVCVKAMRRLSKVN